MSFGKYNLNEFNDYINECMNRAVEKIESEGNYKNADCPEQVFQDEMFKRGFRNGFRYAANLAKFLESE